MLILHKWCSENLKLYNPTSYLGESVLKSVYSKIDTAITRAEERPTDLNLDYAEEAVRRLDVEKNRKEIIKFNERLVAIGANPIELPDYSTELEALKTLINESKKIVE